MHDKRRGTLRRQDEQHEQDKKFVKMPKPNLYSHDIEQYGEPEWDFQNNIYIAGVKQREDSGSNAFRKGWAAAHKTDIFILDRKEEDEQEFTFRGVTASTPQDEDHDEALRFCERPFVHRKMARPLDIPLYDRVMQMMHKVQKYSTTECKGRSIVLVFIGILPVVRGMQNNDDDSKVNDEEEAAMWFTAMLVSLCAILFMIVGMMLEQQTNMMQQAVDRCLHRNVPPCAATLKGSAQENETGGASGSGHGPHDDNANRPAAKPKAKPKAKTAPRRDPAPDDDDDDTGSPSGPRRLQPPVAGNADMVYITRYGGRAHTYRGCRTLDNSAVVYEYPYCRFCTGRA